MAREGRGKCFLKKCLFGIISVGADLKFKMPEILEPCRLLTESFSKIGKMFTDDGMMVIFNLESRTNWYFYEDYSTPKPTHFFHTYFFVSSFLMFFAFTHVHFLFN